VGQSGIFLCQYIHQLGTYHTHTPMLLHVPAHALPREDHSPS
jgi:hypothetical protein